MKKLLLLTLTCFLTLIINLETHAQDTVIVQTLTYDSTGRDYVFDFPPDDGTTYEKIIMEYNMRCKGAQVSVPGNTNLGCGEWDYSCNTYIVDSTKTDSLKATHPSHLISGFQGDTYSYTSQPTFTRYQYIQEEIIIDNTFSETTATVGSGSTPLAIPFATENSQSRSQFLFTKSELNDAGLNGGMINSIRLDVDALGEDISFLRIKIKETSESQLYALFPDVDGFTEVYFLNTELVPGTNRLIFNTPFVWSGNENILVEMSFKNESSGNATTVKASDAGQDMALYTSGENAFMQFNGEANLEVPTGNLNSISDELTIAFWSYGNENLLPSNTIIFNGTDDANRRNALVHLPWSNSQVFWDCGNDGSNYDRINKAVNMSDFAGKWSHWAFTKNVNTGVMNIYLNGTLFHSGTGKTKPIKIRNLVLSERYYGNLDNFQVFDKALTVESIQSLMYGKIDENHPNFNNLKMFYGFDEGQGVSAANAVNPSETIEIEDNNLWGKDREEIAYRNLEIGQQRPNITFVSGDYSVSSIEHEVFDVVQNLPNKVSTFEVQGTDLVMTNEDYLYEAVDELTIAEDGNILSADPVAPEGTINVGTLNYYNKLPSRIEIMSFVTPYGIYLDLGSEGKTWRFDMTDFTPILKGKKRMFLGNGGQNQEEMDIKFLFIKGTPPRDVISMQQIWRPGQGIGFMQIRDDSYFEPVTYNFSPNATSFKVRSMITGHGQEGEFIPRGHSFLINGDNVFNWNVWTECADNPVYPQGGTWIYDRAGWCPGAPTDLQEWDITPHVTLGEPVTLDYTMNLATGDSRYLVNHQLVEYGDINFERDATIERVLSPTSDVEYERTNPICRNPVVLLKNSGSEVMTSATITYGVSGGEMLTYEWTGNIAFSESVEVELPIDDLSFWYGDMTGVFTATVEQVNGSPDEYPNNNSYTTHFNYPDFYDLDKVVLLIASNNRGFENSMRLYDFEGNDIIYRPELENTFLYLDSIPMEENSCYTLEITDSGNDGLEFWANLNQTAGNISIRSETEHLKGFIPDFGSIFRYTFVRKDFVSSVAQIEKDLNVQVFPNPTTSIVNLIVDGDNINTLQLQLSDISGKLLKQKLYENFGGGNIVLDMEDYNPGMFFCTLMTEKGFKTVKIIKSK